MDNNQRKKYPEGTETIRRSKRRYSVVMHFYLHMLWFFLVLFLMESIIFVLDSWELLLENWCFVLGFAIILGLFLTFIGKGSLVETVHIDYEKREIRVLHYLLPNRQRIEVIPFDGFSWDVMNGGRGPDRLRMFTKEGNRIVICEDRLGWTIDDFDYLQSALASIVDKSHWLEHGF